MLLCALSALPFLVEAVEVLREDVQRAESNVDNMAAAALETKAKVVALQAVMDGMRGHSGGGKGTAPIPAATPHQETRGMQGQGGKATGKAVLILENCMRRLYFRNFDEHTENTVISDFIRQWKRGCGEHIEETYSIGKSWVLNGAQQSSKLRSRCGASSLRTKKKLNHRVG